MRIIFTGKVSPNFGIHLVPLPQACIETLFYIYIWLMPASHYSKVPLAEADKIIIW